MGGKGLFVIFNKEHTLFGGVVPLGLQLPAPTHRPCPRVRAGPLSPRLRPRPRQAPLGDGRRCPAAWPGHPGRSTGTVPASLSRPRLGPAPLFLSEHRAENREARPRPAVLGDAGMMQSRVTQDRDALRGAPVWGETGRGGPDTRVPNGSLGGLQAWEGAGTPPGKTAKGHFRSAGQQTLVAPRRSHLALSFSLSLLLCSSTCVQPQLARLFARRSGVRRESPPANALRSPRKAARTGQRPGAQDAGTRGPARDWGLVKATEGDRAKKGYPVSERPCRKRRPGRGSSGHSAAPPNHTLPGSASC